MSILDVLRIKLNLKTKEQKADKKQFERFKKANFNHIYNKLEQFIKDDEFIKSGLWLNETQLRPLVYAEIDRAIYRGVVNKETFEIAPSMEIC